MHVAALEIHLEAEHPNDAPVLLFVQATEVGIGVGLGLPEVVGIGLGVGFPQVPGL